MKRTLKDEIVRLTNIKASAKIRSVRRRTRSPFLGLITEAEIRSPLLAGRWAECLSCSGGELKVALLLQNNTIETYSLKATDKMPTGNKTARLTLGGHRTDVRTLAFSSDNLAFLSASGDTIKVWNR